MSLRTAAVLGALGFGLPAAYFLGRGVAAWRAHPELRHYLPTWQRRR